MLAGIAALEAVAIDAQLSGIDVRLRLLLLAENEHTTRARSQLCPRAPTAAEPQRLEVVNRPVQVIGQSAAGSIHSR